MIKTAVIMGAGLGTRFGKMTELVPKGFVQVGGESMVVSSIEILMECGIERIIIGTGYRREMYEQLMERYPSVECFYSQRYEGTNSMWTLSVLREVIGGDDFLLLESDLIYEKRAILDLLNDQRPNLLLASDQVKFQDQYFVEYDGDGKLINCTPNGEDLNICGEFVGIHKISNMFYRAMLDYYLPIKDMQPKLGYEYVLLYLALNVLPLYVLKIEDLFWYEIDDEKDLRYAESILKKRYGK